MWLSMAVVHSNNTEGVVGRERAELSMRQRIFFVNRTLRGRTKGEGGLARQRFRIASDLGFIGNGNCALKEWDIWSNTVLVSRVLVAWLALFLL